MPTNIITTKDKDIKEIEKTIYDFVCELGQEILKETLEAIDNEIMQTRDKTEYRHKGLKRTCIKTIMGPVEYQRAIYEHINEDGQKEYIYLLDKQINLNTIGHMTQNLVSMIAIGASNTSYRKTAQNISELTGQSLSHSGAWNVIQKLGDKIKQAEKNKIEQYKAGKSPGKKEIKVLFKEADGLWLNMQGKDRPKHGKSKKREIKLAITYEGWKKKHQLKEEYEAINKTAVSGFMKPREFKDLVDANLAQTYNIDEIDYTILNGDGAAWIKIIDENFQLDRFHIYKAICRSTPIKKDQKQLSKLIRANKIDKVLEKIEQLKYDYGGEKSKVKKLTELETYLKNNNEGLIPYQQRKETKLPDPPEGIFYRNMGTMEHNIFDILGYRMKNNKMSWSINGANNLAKILASKASGTLQETIMSLMSNTTSERMLEQIQKQIKNTKKDIKEKKRYPAVYPMKRGGIPYSNSPITDGRKAIRALCSDRPAKELIYR